MIGKILDDFRARRLMVTRINFQESKNRISGFLDWLDSNEITKVILTEIEDSNKSVEVLAKADFNSPPEVSNPEEIVQLGLYFMREVKSGKQLWGLAQKYGIQAKYFTTNVQDIQDEIVERYIEPAIDYIQDKLIEKMEAADSMVSSSPSQADPKKVFVIHGRNKEARDAMFTFLRAIGLQPLEWQHAISMTSNASPYIGQILEKAFHTVQAFVVLLSGDDEARLREPFQKESDEDYEKMLTPQARPNVLFEAGLAFGIHPERVVLVELEKIRPFSDVFGRFTVRITNNIAARQDLATRLRTAGCDVNLDGTDWHNAGDFDSAIIPFIKEIIAKTTEEPDDGYYHFRVQRLITGDGRKAEPEFAFNLDKYDFAKVSTKLYNGRTANIVGVTATGIEINSGIVSLMVLHSTEEKDTASLVRADTEAKEKFWHELRYSRGVSDITAKLDISNHYAG